MKYKGHIPGLFLASVIALLSVYIATFHPSFDALVISIIIGMICNILLSERSLIMQGAASAIGFYLPAGIALYGTQLSLIGVKTSLFVSIFLVVMMTFSITLVLSRIFHLNARIAILLASGLSVCGASAIAVVSPLIAAKREDTSIAILSVMMLGLISMLSYPLLYDVMLFTKDEFTFMAGATLPMIGQVKVAAGNVCSECANSALQIKLVRVAFLVFLIPLTMILSRNRERQILVPWFIVGFLLLSVLSNALQSLKDILYIGRAAGTFCLSAGLAAIGLSVDFDAIIEEGLSSLGIVFASWLAVMIVVFLFRNI